MTQSLPGSIRWIWAICCKISQGREGFMVLIYTYVYIMPQKTTFRATFPLFSHAPFAINTNGVIVGDYGAASDHGNGNVQHGYVLAAGVFQSIDFPGAAFTTAR